MSDVVRRRAEAGGRRRRKFRLTEADSARLERMLRHIPETKLNKLLGSSVGTLRALLAIGASEATRDRIAVALAKVP